jgi:hypothetical protein
MVSIQYATITKGNCQEIFFFFLISDLDYKPSFILNILEYKYVFLIANFKIKFQM